MKEKSNNILRILSETIKDPRTELDYVNNYTLLVAIVLSAQTTDVQVNKATKALFAKVTNPKEMLELGEEGLKQYIKTIGLFNSKAKNVIALSQLLIEKFNSCVPETSQELESLPGVGRKTANVYLNSWHGHSTIAVDTHVFRVSNRTGMVVAKNVVECEKQLMENIDEQYKRDAHHLLILHGRYCCKARKPLCEICPVTKYCDYFQKGGKNV